MDIAAFVSKWHLASGGERKTKDSLLNDLCDALDVPRPDVPTVSTITLIRRILTKTL